MDYPTWMKQKQEQFDAKHSKDGPAIFVDGWLYWPDGAMREHNAHAPMADGVEPPADPAAAGRLAVRYWEHRVQRAQRAFDQLKAELVRDAKAVTAAGTVVTPVQPPPLEESIVRLSAKKAAVAKARRKLEAAREALLEIDPRQRMKNHLEAEQAQRAEAAQMFLEAIRGVEV